MQKYELIRERFTTCSGDRHPQTTMEELTIPDRNPMCRIYFKWKNISKSSSIKPTAVWSLTSTPAASTSASPSQNCNPKEHRFRRNPRKHRKHPTAT